MTYLALPHAIRLYLGFTDTHTASVVSLNHTPRNDYITINMYIIYYIHDVLTSGRKRAVLPVRNATLPLDNTTASPCSSNEYEMSTAQSGSLSSWANGRINGWINGWTNGWMNG